MKNAIIALSVVLALVVFSEVVLFKKYRTAQKEILYSQQNTESLNAKTIQLDQEIFQLKDQISRNDKQIQELENEKKRISVLQNEIRSKDRFLSDYQKKLQMATQNLRQERQKTENLNNELSLKIQYISEILNQAQDLAKAKDDLKNDLDKQDSRYETRISELETGLQIRDEQILDFRRQIKEADARLQSSTENLSLSGNTIADLKEKILGLEKEKASLSRQISLLKSSHDAAISELREAIQGRDSKIADLQDELKKAGAHMQFLEETNSFLYKEIDTLGNEVLSLKEQVLSKESKAEAFQNDIIQLQKEKDKLEADNENQKLGNRELISKLQEEIKNQEHMIQKFRNQLNRAEELAISLGEESKKGQSRQNKLRELLSELKQKEDQHKTKIYQLQSEYTAMVSELKNEIDTREVTIQKLEEKLSITFVDRILFDTGKSTISPQGRKVLNKVGTVLKNVQNRKIRVIGHTDNIPIERKYQHIFPTNWELSAARSAAVVRYFQYKIGLDPINLEVVGRSFYDAVAGNDTQEERSKNRRVNIVIAPKLE